MADPTLADLQQRLASLETRVVAVERKVGVPVPPPPSPPPLAPPPVPPAVPPGSLTTHLDFCTVGDSITDGYSGQTPGAYRRQFAKRLKSAGIDVSFVGGQVDGAGFHHEGHSGWTISDVAGSIDGWIAAARPSAASLLIGTNDEGHYHGGVPEGAIDRFATLLDKTLADLKPYKAPLFVMNLIPRKDSAAGDVAAFNKLVPGVIQNRIAAGASIVFVEVYSRFPADGLSGDNLHPLDKGFDAMGDALADAVIAWAKRTAAPPPPPPTIPLTPTTAPASCPPLASIVGGDQRQWSWGGRVDDRGNKLLVDGTDTGAVGTQLYLGTDNLLYHKNSSNAWYKLWGGPGTWVNADDPTGGGVPGGGTGTPSPSPVPAQPSTVPVAASEVGFTKPLLVIDSFRPDVIGSKLFREGPSGWNMRTLAANQVGFPNPDQMELYGDGAGPNLCLRTARLAGNGTSWDGVAPQGGFYAEVVAAYGDPNNRGGGGWWSVIWAMSQGHLDPRRGIDNLPVWAEIDGQEDMCFAYGTPADSYQGTLHEWKAGGETGQQNQQQIAIPGGRGGKANFHRYGFRVVRASGGAKGHIRFYLDGNPVGQPVTYGAGERFSLGGEHAMGLILGTGAGQTVKYRSLAIYGLST